ncbi:MAG: ABC transporter permease [Oscillospiraceae bacterium]|nr:ABC transporter permease [Oscillospiraceae bacterium]MCR4760511.1 ABC transporter permease [Oscillospiraceae bacterium]
MQVFKLFLKILRKKTAVALIYFAVFITLIIAMTYTNNQTAVFEQKRLNICVFDEDDTPESRALSALIAKENDIISLENDRDVLLDALYYEQADYILTVRRGYAEKLGSGSADSLFDNMYMHDSYATAYMEQYLNEYVRTVRGYLAAGKSQDEAVGAAADAVSAKTDVSIAAEESRQSALSEKAALYFRYLPYILISTLMNVMCPVLLAITRKDVRFRTNCSGLPPTRGTMQIFAGSAIFVSITWLLFAVIGCAINGSLSSSELWLALLNSSVFLLFSAALTVFVASFNPETGKINILTQIISLGMCFLCGVFVEQPLLGEKVLRAARFLPAYWYIKVTRMLDGSEVYQRNTVITAILMELGFAAVTAILTVLIRRLKYSRSGISVSA